jgi:spermidine synthase
MEKHQYGQFIEFEKIETIVDTKTEHSHIEFVKTKNHGNVLLMNSEVQFSTTDEHRYHEMLVHPILEKCENPMSVLILGGGDGLAAREVCKWASVQKVTIVDYDNTFVEMAKYNPEFCSLNKHVYSRSNVRYICCDAVTFMNKTSETFDVILIDLPDPEGELLDVYKRCIVESRGILRENGVIGLHVGPVHPNSDFENWKTVFDLRNTLDISYSGLGKQITFGSVYVPSFTNEWGFLYLHDIAMKVNLDKSFIHTKYWMGGEIPSRDILDVYQRLS